jgi:four helix bundle protein
MESKIKNFYDLEAWKEGHKLVLDVYKITSDFPNDEKFGIISQLRRAVSSITANIAEGFERYHF